MKNQLRIIGGSWRGRKLNFADAKGLRPTLDRVRETLFNWLQNDIYDSYCLDLYSGSGALGFEALSRGAAHVTMVDNNRQVYQQLTKNMSLLNCDNVDISCISAMDFLSTATIKNPYQIVFLDPPFKQNLLDTICKKLEQHNILSANCLIYIEAEKMLQLTAIPENWTQLKEKKTGQLAYYLFQRKL